MLILQIRIGIEEIGNCYVSKGHTQTQNFLILQMFAQGQIKPAQFLLKHIAIIQSFRPNFNEIPRL